MCQGKGGSRDPHLPNCGALGVKGQLGVGALPGRGLLAEARGWRGLSNCVLSAVALGRGWQLPIEVILPILGDVGPLPPLGTLKELFVHFVGLGAFLWNEQLFSGSCCGTFLPLSPSWPTGRPEARGLNPQQTGPWGKGCGRETSLRGWVWRAVLLPALSIPAQ